MKVFVGMETSGAFRGRFAAMGHDARSADLLPAEDDGAGHIVGDVFEALDALRARGWWPDLAIFHPTCTYLTNSAAWAFNDPDYGRYPGVGYHQRVATGTLVGAERRKARALALNDVRRIMALPIRRKVIENPIGAISAAIRKPTQIIQPYEFGDDASKATCFWYVGADGEELPDMRLPVYPAKRVAGRMVPRARAMGASDRANGCANGCAGPAFIERWANQTDTGQNRLSPGGDRWKERSRTFPGIADAGAAHWAGVSEMTNDIGDIFG